MIRANQRKRRVCLAVLVVTIISFLNGCSGQPENEEKKNVQQNAGAAAVVRAPEFRSLLPPEAFALMERDKNTLVVDVRTADEREQLRIPGSVPVSLGELMQGQAQLPRDTPLLLVCSVGGRSYAAGLYLVKEKYQWVYNLRGGIVAWEKAGLPLEQGRN